MKMRRIAVSWILFAAGWLSAATLNVDLDVCTSVDERNAAAAKAKEVAVFLLDQSYSMTSKAVEVDRPDKTRDEVLREMLKVRLDTIAEKRPNTQVYVITFSGNMCGPFGPYSAKDGSEIFSKLKCTKGGTLLYDTLAHAIEFGEGLLQQDPEIKIRMFVYSDGKNELFNDYWERQKPGFLSWPERVPVVYRDDNAAKAFKRDYLGRIREHALNGRMSLETGCWLGPGNPPDLIENKRKDDYKLELTSDGAELKNPASNSTQGMSARLVLPIPQQYEKDLANLRATVECEVEDRRVSGVVSLKPGRHTVKLNLPGDLPKAGFKGKLAVTNLPDAWDRISLSEPDPVDLGFAAPGSLSFISLDPREDVYVKVGEKVQFSAQAGEDAVVSWSVRGESVNQASFAKAFDCAGSYDVTVTAGKEGLLPARASFKVYVIDTAVTVDMEPGKPKVGEKVRFAARAGGAVQGYTWWVDGQSSTAKDKTLGGQVFDRSGVHGVKVRAIFGHGIVGEAERSFEVAAKPNIVIDAPYNGQCFEFGAEVKAFANVEGDYEKVVWELKGPDSQTETTPVDRESRVSKPLAFKPAKGGEYTLVATAEGNDAKLTSSPVKFSVKREDVMVRIDTPVSGASVEIGKDCEMRAAVKGESIKEVKWTVAAKSKVLFSATKPVQGGVSSCAFNPAATLGNGSVLIITAEAVNEPEVKSTVDVETRFLASLKIVSAKIGDRDVNGLQANFGEQVVLEASCSGGVDPTQVEWVAESNGRESVIGKGLKVNAPKVSPNELKGNSAVLAVNYFARAKLPDGSRIASGKVSAYFACDDLSLGIVLPKGDDGITRTQFGLKKPVNVELSVAGGTVGEVNWKFSDGATAKGAAAAHAFDRYGKYTVSASAKCKRCGKVFMADPVEIEVMVLPPKAKFEIQEKGSYYTVGSKLHLASTSEGDVEDYVWTVDGVELSEFRGKPEAVVHTSKKPCEMVLGLQAIGPDGTAPSSCEREIRVRYGWWAIVILALLALLVIGGLAWLLFGNGPAGWQVQIVCAEGFDLATDDGVRRERRKCANGIIFPLGRFWSLWQKAAMIPLKKLEEFDSGISKFLAKCSNSAACLIVRQGENGRPDVGRQGMALNDVGKKELDGVFYRQFRASKPWEEGKTPRFIRILIDDSKVARRYGVCFVILTLFVLGTAAYAMCMYAI